MDLIICDYLKKHLRPNNGSQKKTISTEFLEKDMSLNNIYLKNNFYLYPHNEKPYVFCYIVCHESKTQFCLLLLKNKLVAFATSQFFYNNIAHFAFGTKHPLQAKDYNQHPPQIKITYYTLNQMLIKQYPDILNKTNTIDDHNFQEGDSPLQKCNQQETNIIVHKPHIMFTEKDAEALKYRIQSFNEKALKYPYCQYLHITKDGVFIMLPNGIYTYMHILYQHHVLPVLSQGNFIKYDFITNVKNRQPNYFYKDCVILQRGKFPSFSQGKKIMEVNHFYQFAKYLIEKIITENLHDNFQQILFLLNSLYSIYTIFYY